MTNWLFVRGLSREQRHWHPFPARFEEGVPGARVHLLDLPGAGTERGRACPLTVDEVVDDMRARWSRLRDEHAGPWGLLGISLGGMVALRWVAEHPGDFERAVVINTSAADLSLPWRRMGLGVLPGVARSLRAPDPVARERAVLEVTTRVFRDHASLAPRWAEFARDRPMTRANALRQLVAGLRFRSPARVEVPLLVLTAAGDALAAPECGRRLAAKYGARHDEHPTAGHDLPLDDAAWVTARVADFAG